MTDILNMIGDEISSLSGDINAPFKPHAYYDKHLDCIRVHLENKLSLIHI